VRRSRRGGVEAVEDAVEDLLSADLALTGGVVTLSLQGGSELDGGDEEAAGFADGLEVAVHLDRSSAVPVAEHAPVHLSAKFAHFAAFVIAGELAGLAVECFDLLGDGEGLVGDGLVGYPTVDGFLSPQVCSRLRHHNTALRYTTVAERLLSDELEQPVVPPDA
jgi:hypothetical protein